MTDYLALNRANWDDRAAAHAASPDYAVSELIDGTRRLSGVVAFDEERLGDIRGLETLHLQCHIGTDTLSLHRLGARVTGLDFSPASLAEARRIASSAGAPIDYVESDVYSAPEALGDRTFDLVYTGIGALCWLPSADRWAQVVASLLRPGGRLFIREGHPMLWTFEETGLQPEYSYFEQPEGNTWTDGGTYVATDHVFTANAGVDWNHGLGEIVTALLRHGLQLTGLVEHDSVPWCALPGLMSVDEHGEWRLTERPERLAASYTLQAVKT